MFKRIAHTITRSRAAWRGTLGSASAFFLTLGCLSGEVVLHDNFENRWDSEPLHGSITSDQLWTWHAHTSSATVVETAGNRYANFNGQSVVSTTWRSRESGLYMYLDPNRPFELEFDYLSFATTTENRWLIIDYLLADRWTNMGAVSATDPVGYRLYVRALSDTEIAYEILHKANGEWSRVPGSVGSLQTASGIFFPDGGTTHGRPVRVVLYANGNHQRLSIDGQEQLDLLIDPHLQNRFFQTYNFIQFWSELSLPRGIDNVTIRQLEAVPVSVSPGEVYWANTTMIRTAESDGSLPRTAARDLSRGIGVAVDPDGEHVYWADGGNGNIMRAGLDGSDPEVIVTGASGASAQSIAVDPALGKVFWAEWTTGLFSADLDGSNAQQLLDLGDYGQTTGSSAVALDPVTGHVYWGTVTDGTIIRMNPDGSDKTPVATLGANTYGLAVDNVRGRLYYTTFSTNGSLNYYDFNSGASTEVFTELGQPLGIAMNEAGDALFWTERTDGKIRSVRILEDGFGQPETLVEGENSPFGIAVMPGAEGPALPPGPYVGFVNGDFEDEDGFTNGWSFVRKIEPHAGIAPGSATAALIPSDKTAGDFPVLSQHRPNWLQFDMLPANDPATGEPLAPQLFPTGPRWRVSFYTAVADAGAAGNRSLNINIGNEREEGFTGSAPAINFRINGAGAGEAYWGGAGSTKPTPHTWFEVFPPGTFTPSTVENGEFVNPTVYFVQFDGDYTLEMPAYTVSAWEVTDTEWIHKGSKTKTAFQYREPPTGTGIITVRFHGNVEAPYVVDDVTMITLDNVEPAGYAAWADLHFNSGELADPAISGPAADPDGDGVANLLEYALAGNPRVANRGVLPLQALIEVEGEEYLSLTFVRPVDAADLSYHVDAGSELTIWSAGPLELSVTSNGDGTETVTYRDSEPVGNSERRFLRLRVEVID